MGRIMHDTALRLGQLAIEIYGTHSEGSILEIGALDVNGSLRSSAPPLVRYVGVDLEPGPGVDLVIAPHAPLPMPDDTFNLVIASSVLEHDPAFWQTFLEMCRVAAPGGYVYLNAPSNGLVHRYPEDHWRFYPDCGKALSRWAKSQGQAAELIESFTVLREGDIWNDFVAVFRKGAKGGYAEGGDKETRALHREVACENIILGNKGELLEPAYETEDMRIIAASRSEAAAVMRQRDRAREDLATAERTYDIAVERIAELEARTNAADAENASLVADLNLERESADAAIAEAQKERASLVRQQEASVLKLMEVSAKYEECSTRLEDSEKWNFRLAKERADLQKEVRSLRQKASRSERETKRWKASAFEASTEKAVIANALLKAERDRSMLEVECSTLQAQLEELEIRLKERENELRQLHEDFQLLQMRLQERNREVGTLSLRILAEDRKVQMAESQSEWLGEVSATVIETATWWNRLFARRRRVEAIEQRLQRRGLFDAAAYLKRYPDVRSSGMPAVVHYIRHGRGEGRNWQ